MLNWEKLSGQLGYGRPGPTSAATCGGPGPIKPPSTSQCPTAPKQAAVTVVARAGRRRSIRRCFRRESRTAATAAWATRAWTAAGSIEPDQPVAPARRIQLGPGLPDGGRHSGIGLSGRSQRRAGRTRTGASCCERIHSLEPPSDWLLDLRGKKAFVTGIANNRSIAWALCPGSWPAPRVCELRLTYTARHEKAVSRPRCASSTAPLEPSLVPLNARTLEQNSSGVQRNRAAVGQLRRADSLPAFAGKRSWAATTARITLRASARA